DAPVALEAYRAAVAAAGPGAKGLKEWDWFTEMVLRIEGGRQPVTEAEYRELEAWYYDNEHRGPYNSYLDVGDDQRVSRPFVRWKLESGPRGSDATEVVEHLRALRAVLG